MILLKLLKVFFLELRLAHKILVNLKLLLLKVSCGLLDNDLPQFPVYFDWQSALYE
jgi:flagellar biosynthesis protein FliR